MRTALVALSVAIATAITPAAARAQARVIPPGREGAVMAMLGGALPDGCALGSAAIERDRVRADYACGDARVAVELLDPDLAPVELPRARALAIRFEGAWPDHARRALLERVRAEEPDDFWERAWIEERAAETAAAGPTTLSTLHRVGTAARLQLATLALALALAAIGAALHRGGPRRGPARTAPSAPALHPVLVALLAAIPAVAIALVTARTFRFAWDDYENLLVARAGALLGDRELRLLGVRAPFALAQALGASHAAFVAIHLGTALATALALALLARRAGHSRAEALLAGAWAVSSSYLVPVLRWGVGVQHVAVIAWIALAMLAMDEASRATAPRARAGAVLLAIAAALAAVLTKYPVAAILPFLTLLWARRIVPRSPDARSSPLPHLALGAAIAIPIALRHLLGGRSSEPALAGDDPLVAIARAIPHNLGELAVRAEPMLLLAAAVALARAAQRTLAPRAAIRATHAPGALLGLAALSTLPFLANAAYFTDYYPALAHAWLCALAAPLVLRHLAALSPRAALPLALAIALLAAPGHGARAALHGGSPADGSEAFVRGAARALGARARDLGALVVRDRCEGGAPPHLREMLDASGGAEGLRWALERPTLEVTIADPAAPPPPLATTLSWCAGEWRLESPP